MVAPAVVVLLMCLSKILEETIHVSFVTYGVLPRTLTGLRGILLSPFIHKDFAHLFSNIIPLFILGSVLIYFYGVIARRVIAIIFFMSGFWLWLAGREAYHIGASTLVYGLVFFLFLSGVLRRHNRLLAISMLIAFLYGGVVWGLLPVDQSVSFEGHIFGALAGVVCALAFRKEGPQRKEYQWDDEDLDDEDEYWNHPDEDPNKGVNVNYIYKPEVKREDGASDTQA